MGEYVTKASPAKKVAIEALKKTLSEYRDFVFADYRGLSVEQITNLRTALRKHEARFKILKNNFARIAFSELDYPDVSDYLIGPTAVALARDDAGQVIQQLLDFGKDSPVKVKGGLVDRRVYDFKQVEALSKLPTKTELYAKLMGTMQAPVQYLAYTMTGVASKLVRTLQAVADKKKSD